MPDTPGDDVADRAAIHELLARYARGVDTKDWALWQSVFTADADIDFSAIGTRGSPVVVGQSLAAALDSAHMSLHYVTNVEVDLEGGSASVRALYFATVQTKAGGPLLFSGGTYMHRLVRSSTGWRSAKMESTLKWVVSQ